VSARGSLGWEEDTNGGCWEDAHGCVVAVTVSEDAAITICSRATTQTDHSDPINNRLVGLISTSTLR
jgi:hypothetical protein